MRLHRFYVTQPLGEVVVIHDVSLIHQIVKVFRYTIGDTFILFNGEGRDVTYLIEAIPLRNRKGAVESITLAKKSELFVPLPSAKKVLYIALIKKDLFELVVQKAVELGVTDIVPLISAHTERKQLPIERLQTILKEASEQCGRADIPSLHEELEMFSLSSSLASFTVSKARAYVATLRGIPIQIFMKQRFSEDVRDSVVSSSCFVIGPEGGWSDEEEKFFTQEAYTCVSLGETVLRAETAAITCAFLLKNI